MLVDDFVGFINDEHEKFFSPSSWICVDESISHWCGTGGDWINEGVPMRMAIDCKPENGCEIQDACDGETGIMLCLKIVKTADAEERSQIHPLGEDLNHGTKVLAHLVMPWACTMHTVCTDSHFASVQAAKHLFHLGLRFIGIVKTATHGFPQDELASAQC